MASLTAFISAYRSPCAPRLQNFSLRVGPLALAARPGGRQVLPFSTRVSVPKVHDGARRCSRYGAAVVPNVLFCLERTQASAAVADWVSEEHGHGEPAESEAESQSFSSLFEAEDDSAGEEEVADETLLVRLLAGPDPDLCC